MKLNFTGTLSRSPENVWKAVRTFRAVNSELFPIMQMMCPKDYLDRPFEEFPLGVFLFHSLVLFLGWIPMEVSHARLMQVDPNKGFIEYSEMALAKKWIHRRILEPSGGGCRITDELEIVPRLSILKPLLWLFVNLLFWNRHRRLRWKFQKECSVPA